MIKITDKYEEQLTEVLAAYMERNKVKTKSEAVLKMVLGFAAQAEELTRLHNKNVELEKELDNYRYTINHVKQSLKLIHEIT